MSLYPSLEKFVNYLNGSDNKLGFLSPNFIAFRNSERIDYKSVKSVIEYFDNIKPSISDISIIEEDSHFLLFYKVNDIKYIIKVKLDENKMIESLLEEKYDESFKMIVAEIEYDGSSYFGIQRQKDPSQNTIQEEIEKALKFMIKKDVSITIASRTDRGVHANGQVIMFESNGIDSSRYKYALNEILPDDIKIINIYERSQVFNCRYDVIKKDYEYVIETGEYSVFNKNYLWHQKINNLEKIKEEMKYLLGTHDFEAFCRGEKDNTIRTIYEASVIEVGTKIVFKFSGNGFLHNMIRFIIGSLIEIDQKNVGSIKEIIESKDKNKTYKIAPASGLYLKKIYY